MTNLADPVLDDIKEVCQNPVTQEDLVTEVNKPVDVRIKDTYCCPKISSRDKLMDIFSVTSQKSDMNQPA
ncbi:hypothetical protein J4Q44_G00096010 [Coregonus suidteri]|uniref:Uncharacterized protein n=1 Tax=Coregonus suidteri TaxID=861788 RepID=A0AAN8QZG4_9TELE